MRYLLDEVLAEVEEDLVALRDDEHGALREEGLDGSVGVRVDQVALVQRHRVLQLLELPRPDGQTVILSQHIRVLPETHTYVHTIKYKYYSLIPSKWPPL